MKTFIHFMKNKNIYLTYFILGIMYIYPFNSFAENLPRSYINQTETFVLECPNNPQHTTYDMDTCNGTMITQPKAVQE